MQRFQVSSSGAALGVNKFIEDARAHRDPIRSTVAAAATEPAAAAMPGLRRRAMVIDRVRTSRAFIAEALNAFEPGFNVVTAMDTDQAAEWTEAFVPDLIVVDVDDSGAAGFIEDISSLLQRPCRVIWIGGSPAPDAAANGEGQAVVQRDVGLAELLRTIRTVWEG